MKNRIMSISKTQFKQIKSTINLNETFLVELDGNNIQNERQLFDVMEKAYNLHTLNGTWGKNWAAFDDLMTDLDWIGYDKYILTIFSFKSFMSKDLNGKRLFLEYFKESILRKCNDFAGSFKKVNCTQKFCPFFVGCFAGL